MKKFLFMTVVMLAGMFTSCSEHSVDIEALPDAVAAFVSKYYPGVSISRFENSSQGCTVYLHNSSTIKFDGAKSRAWTSIDGNGGVLPQMLIYDQTPVALYRYLENMDAVDKVYIMSRDKTEYKLTTYGSRITYNISTGAITGV